MSSGFADKIRYKYELNELTGEGKKKVKEVLDDEKLSKALKKPYERIEKIKQTFPLLVKPCFITCNPYQVSCVLSDHKIITQGGVYWV